MSEGSRVSLVTGAGSGIGRAIAEKLAQDGERVVVNDLRDAIADEVVAGIKGNGGEAASAPGDVSDPEAVGRMVETAREAFGPVGRPRRVPVRFRAREAVTVRASRSDHEEIAFEPDEVIRDEALM